MFDHLLLIYLILVGVYDIQEVRKSLPMLSLVLSSYPLSGINGCLSWWSGAIIFMSGM
jgi:hypothetical protein